MDSYLVEERANEATRAALRLTAIYVLVGVAWIALSDRLLLSVVRDPALISNVQTAKGWVFVVATGVLFYWLSTRELSRRVTIERSLRESNHRLRAVIQASPLAITILDTESRVLLWSPMAERIFGWSSEEVLGKRIPTVPPERIGEHRELLRRVQSGEVITNLEVRRVRKDGSPIEIDLSMGLIRDDAGNVEGFIAVYSDISERKRAEQELADASDRLLQAEVEKKHFYHEVIRAVTQDKLHLVDADEIEQPGELILDRSVNSLDDFAALRAELREVAQSSGMEQANAEDLVLMVGEAVTNAIKHASGGRCVVTTTDDQIIARVSDCGTGIQFASLPASVLTAGFSTKVSLGMGYTIMLQLADQIRLATGPRGTVVQLEKWIHPGKHPRPPLPASWRHF